MEKRLEACYKSPVERCWFGRGSDSEHGENGMEVREFGGIGGELEVGLSREKSCQEGHLGFGTTA